MNISVLRKRSIVLLVSGALMIATAGTAYAAFSDKGKVLGSSFTVASSDLKILKNVSLGHVAENLADELPGPSFASIGQTWSGDYALKLYNNGSAPVNLTSNANYTTSNDPDDLRSSISVELFPWQDGDSDGVVDSGELGTAVGKKTIVKWKTEGFSLGSLAPGQVYGLVMRFSTENLSSTKQGKTALFDFEFDSIGQ